MISPRIRQFLRLQRIIMGFFGIAVGLILAAVTEWFVTQGLGLLPWVIGVTLILGLLALTLSWRKPIGIDVAIRSPRTIRSAEESHQYARRGFIGFVPLFRPNAGTAAATLSPEAWAQAVETFDFDRLQVEESNLRPTIEAIASHAGRLEHCWLLATRGKEVPGSLPYASLLAKYLREQKGLTCKFYYGAAYTISLDDDALVLSKTYDQVQQIIEQATRLGMTPQELVADITSGIRSMTLGMVLACLNGDQDVEFVGTRYNAQGQPTGDLFPIIFSFEPSLNRPE